eukprot:PhF_6_TR1001/c0_g1_i3/m.1986
MSHSEIPSVFRMHSQSASPPPNQTLLDSPQPYYSSDSLTPPDNTNTNLPPPSSHEVSTIDTPYRSYYQHSTLKDLESYITTVQENCRAERRESSLALKAARASLVPQNGVGENRSTQNTTTFSTIKSHYQPSSTSDIEDAALISQLQEQVRRLTQQLSSREDHIVSLSKQNQQLTSFIAAMQAEATVWATTTTTSSKTETKEENNADDTASQLRYSLLNEDLKKAQSRFQDLSQEFEAIQDRLRKMSIVVLQSKWRATSYRTSQRHAEALHEELKTNFGALQEKHKESVQRVKLLESEIVGVKEKMRLMQATPIGSQQHSSLMSTSAVGCQTEDMMIHPQQLHSSTTVMNLPSTTPPSVRCIPLSGHDAERAFVLLDYANIGALPLRKVALFLTCLGLLPQATPSTQQPQYQGIMREAILSRLYANKDTHPFLSRQEWFEIIHLCQSVPGGDVIYGKYNSTKTVLFSLTNHDESSHSSFLPIDAYPDVRPTPLTDTDLSEIFLLFDWAPTSGIHYTALNGVLECVGIPASAGEVTDALLVVDTELTGLLTFTLFKQCVMKIQQRVLRD